MAEPARAPPAPATLRLVRLPALPAAPQPQTQQELLSVVVSEVPVKTLLFALARDNRLNVDIHPSIAGQVTINATDQTLPQLLDRIAQQADLRYEMTGNTVRLQRDTPYLGHYAVDYVNLKRQSSSQTSVSSQLSGSTAGSSNASISNAADNQFWDTLINNACLIVGAANLEFKQKDDIAQKQERERERDDRLRIAMELSRAAPERCHWHHGTSTPSMTTAGNPRLAQTGVGDK